MLINRDEVEDLLDLQLNIGRIPPEYKEEIMREFDGLAQQEQYQNNAEDDNQTKLSESDNISYPGVGQSHSILSVHEVVVVFAIAFLLVICALRGSVWSAVFMIGVLFTYLFARAIAYYIKSGEGISFKIVLALLCGIGLIAFGVFEKVGSTEAKDAFYLYKDILAIGSIILVGIGLIVGPFIVTRYFRNKFTQKVEAKCIEIRTPRYGSGVPVIITPVYEYCYNGQYQRVMKEVYSNKANPEVGETREIYINPDIPGDYYEPNMSRSNYLLFCKLGVFFIFMGILAYVVGF